MHEQHKRAVARTLVNVCNAQASDLGVLRRVGKIGQVGKARLGGTQELRDGGERGHRGVLSYSVQDQVAEAAKWNHNGFIMDGECRAHHFDTEEYS